LVHEVVSRKTLVPPATAVDVADIAPRASRASRIARLLAGRDQLQPAQNFIVG
jgi:hypothetical protein